MVDRKEIIIPTKYNSYRKKEPLSLEELMESPAFNETVYQEYKNIYKKVKPTIDREKCKDIPGMQDLWKSIDELTQKLKECGDTTSKEYYHLKHQLIELRREQYLLKDAAFPELPPIKNYGIYYQSDGELQANYPIYPCGVMSKQNDRDFICPYKNNRTFAAKDISIEIAELKKQNKPYLDFTNKEHIYHLCLKYYELKDLAEKSPDSLLNNILWTLDFYIDKANLNEQQMLILEGKKQRLLNKEICRRLMSELGIYHQENYVSTIWNKITQLIADAADLNYDEWCCKDYEKAWKKCNCCGEMKLRTSKNFVRKAKSADGLTNRCKLCDQKKRRGEN